MFMSVAKDILASVHLASPKAEHAADYARR
jgi:hypothetical protein